MSRTQRLKYDLQVKKDRVFKAPLDTRVDELRIFFDFLHTNILLNGLLNELHTDLPDYTTAYNEMKSRKRISWPSTEIERVKLCLSFLEHLINDRDRENPAQIAFQIGCHGFNFRVGSDFYFENFFMPFYEYVDRHIEENTSVLCLIEKFKLRSQWFDREYLFKIFNSNLNIGESKLETITRKYLFDNGIDYPFSTPASDSGRADIVANLHTSDPLIIEIKIFDGKSRNKSYIQKGVTQIIEYMTDYNKSVGYLVIFNVCNKDLKFSLTCREKPPRLIINNKTIYIMDIDIFHDSIPASKKLTLDIYEIKEDELIIPSPKS